MTTVRGWRVLDADELRQRSRVRDRAKRGGRGYDGVSDERIFARDKWVCLMPECVCPEGRAIDRELAGTGGEWAPSVDHIIPLSEGGADSARNKRAAHARCNNSANEAAQRELGDPGSPREPVPLAWTIGDALADQAEGLRDAV